MTGISCKDWILPQMDMVSYLYKLFAAYLKCLKLKADDFDAHKQGTCGYKSTYLSMYIVTTRNVVWNPRICLVCFELAKRKVWWNIFTIHGMISNFNVCFQESSFNDTLGLEGLTIMIQSSGDVLN